MVQPVPRFVVWKVSLVTDDGRQSEEENAAIELEGLYRYSGGPLALEGFKIQDTKAKHSRHTTIGHEKGKISTRQEEIDEEGKRQKSGPHQDVGIQRLNRNALFPSLFAIIFARPGLLETKKCIVSRIEKR